MGLFKGDAFVSASASTINACYFRHALALDERRVKFMPEYFVELNSHRGKSENNDHAKEVWFAGSHGDVCVNCQSTLIIGKIVMCFKQRWAHKASSRLI